MYNIIDMKCKKYAHRYADIILNSEYTIKNEIDGILDQLNFSNIELKFKNNRFFKCSAIGHTREIGRYNPHGILDPMEWIFQTADAGLKAVLHENEYGNVMRGE